MGNAQTPARKHKKKLMQFVEMVVLEQDIDHVIEEIGKHNRLEIQFKEELNHAAQSEKNHFLETFTQLQHARSYLALEDCCEFSPEITLPQSHDTETAHRILAAVASLKKREAELHAHLSQVMQAEHEARAFENLHTAYSELDNLTFLTIRIGHVLPEELDDLTNAVRERAVIVPLGEDKSKVLIASSKKGRFALDAALKKFHFIPLKLPEHFKGVPEGVIEGLTTEEHKIEEILESIALEKKTFADAEGNALSCLLQTFSLAAQVCTVKSSLETAGSVYRIAGWIPGEDTHALLIHLEAITNKRIVMRLYDAAELPSIQTGEEKVPSDIKHNRFVRSFERMILAYGAPLYGSIDPTPFVAVSFTVLFGIMFGDVGQGALFFILGLLLLGRKIKFLNRWAHFDFVFIGIGIASMTMGILTGEFFTNHTLLIPMSRFLTGLFGTPHNHILQILPEKGAITKLFFFFGFTMGLGFIINSLGIIINIINKIRRGKITESILSKTGVCGLVFFWYAVWLIIKTAALHNSIALYDFIILIIPLAALFFADPLTRLFSGVKPVFENGLFSSIIEGLVETMETISGYISNSISFVRVGVFALSHAILSFIVFTVTDLLGGYFSAGILVTILGNIIIILLEGLIVAIQVVRLQYYEFFSKFFTQTGREFKPFTFTYGKQ